MSYPALFLDRDGIFNALVFRDGNFHSPRNWEEVKHYSLDGLEGIKSLGFKLVMVTNQPDIERKIISESFVEELNNFYQERFKLDRVYICPFASNEHPQKKPNPGMFFLAKKELNLDLSDSYMLGDTDRDTLAAYNCGMKSIIWNRDYNQKVKSDFRVNSVQELVTLLKSFNVPSST